ncbi:putative DNA repair protein [Babesia divergens]|uniref:DNA mismatch repair protein n=1 Tax=Babesia divergens TaxID=32595 RepID=A0AAD9GFJ1_BABDI|nr:putative DNA repair protein [Babesia divergens]
MQIGIKAYFQSTRKAPAAQPTDSVNSCSQGSVADPVADKADLETVTPTVDVITPSIDTADRTTACDSAREPIPCSQASVETICPEPSETAQAGLFDDDESPVCRKRSLLFDETFVMPKVKCTEITEDFISSHIDKIEALISQGDDTSVGAAASKDSGMNRNRCGPSSECATSRVSPQLMVTNLGRGKNETPTIAALKQAKGDVKEGDTTKKDGKPSKSSQRASSKNFTDAPLASDDQSPEHDGDIEAFSYAGHSETPAGPDTRSLTVGREEFHMSLQSEDCVTDEERKKYLTCPASQKSKCFKAYVEHYYRYNDTFTFPPWVRIHEIRDRNGLRPTDESYDPSTLWVPSRSHRWAVEYRSCHFTECMQQWWYLKQDRFDQLLFFKMGRFYELFYHDACIVQEICGLRWMGSEAKPHVGFPEKSLHIYASSCVSRGFKVVVVEQTETPQQLEQRNKETGQRQNAVSRAICEIITPGTIVRPEMLTTQSKQLLLVAEASMRSTEGAASDTVEKTEKDEHSQGAMRDSGGHNPPTQLSPRASRDRLICVCSMDVSIGAVSFGLIDVTSGVGELRDLIVAVNPAEVVVDSAAATSFEDVYHMTEHMGFELTTFNCAQDLTVENVGNPKSKIVAVDHSDFLTRVKTTLGEDSGSYERLLLLLQRYLKSVMLDNLLNYCTIGHIGNDHNRCMILDGAALSQLELFSSQEGDSSLSLFGFLNKTRSAVGERMLRRWLLKPLLNARRINERSLTVEFLSRNFALCTEYQEKLSTIPDLERSFGKVLNAAAGCYKMAVYFDDDVFSKLFELHQLLEHFTTLQRHVKEFFKEAFSFGEGCPALLRDMDAGAAPVDSHCKDLLSKLHVFGTKTCTSSKGTWEQSDEIRNEISSTKSLLDQVLAEIKRTCPSAAFVHTKFRYEVELSEREYKRMSGSKASLEVTSTRAGFVRVRNDRIVSLLQKLEAQEFSLTQSELLFFQHAVKLLHEKRGVFTTLLNTAAEVDCLCSLASVAKNSTIPMVRAEVCERGDGEPYMFIRNSTHPIVCQMNPDTFVPNDVQLNTGDFLTLLLLTGPNMGGKSTLLRQTALCAIMAQMGSFVAGKYEMVFLHTDIGSECKFTVVDRIFTRLGASDNIIQGKSTFLVELEEVSSILRWASRDSLVLVDELGRGTSTFDATAIAAASLEKISSIGSRCLFTTHFQEVCEHSVNLSNVSLCHMTASFDEEERTLVFLYKLALGQCPESHGIHVAKLAGIPHHVLEMAQKVSRKFRVQKTPPAALARALLSAHERNDTEALRTYYEQLC